MIKLTNLLKENSSSTYEFGCVMLYFDFPLIKTIHKIINEWDIYIEDGDKTYGLEDEPHITLLYGLHSEVTLDDIKKVIDGFEFKEKYTINNASLFKNDKYDVLKFESKDTSDLININNSLKKYPYTSTFKDYKPHLTIGYIKSGEGDKYANLMDGLEFDLHPTHVVFSHADGNKDKISIKIKKNQNE